MSSRIVRSVWLSNISCVAVVPFSEVADALLSTKTPLMRLIMRVLESAITALRMGSVSWHLHTSYDKYLAIYFSNLQAPQVTLVAQGSDFFGFLFDLQGVFSGFVGVRNKNVRMFSVAGIGSNKDEIG